MERRGFLKFLGLGTIAAVPAFAKVSSNIGSIVPAQKDYSADLNKTGSPENSHGQLSCYQAGTTIRQNVYKDRQLRQVHENPVKLYDSTMVFLDQKSNYRVVLRNKDGGIIYTFDNIYGHTQWPIR